MAKKIDLNGLDHFKEKENAMIASEYSSSKTYAVGDYCYHAGTLYCCTTAITTAENWMSGHWTAAKLADDCSALKTAVTDVSEGFAYLPIINNEYVKDNGDFANYTGWFRTPKIQIPDNTKYLLIYIPANTQYSAWYDSNGDYLSKLNLVGGAGWKRMTIPTGAKYFAISNDKQYADQYLFCGNEKMTELFNFLLSDYVINSEQEITTNSSGKPASILHKRNGNTIRTDAINYSGNIITESRTDSATGFYITITTNLSTLETEVQ